MNWRILGFVWLLPVTILVWLLYILPFWAMGHIAYAGRRGIVVTFAVVENNNWYWRAWLYWAGWSGPCVIIDRSLNAQGWRHELRHCDQQLLLGPLFYPVYLANSLIAYARGGHAHLDNELERDARRHAGQAVWVPRSMWSTPRWPWRFGL